MYLVLSWHVALQGSYQRARSAWTMYEEGEVADLSEQILSLGFTGGSEWLRTEEQCPHLNEAGGKTPIFPDVSLDF